MSRSRSRRQVDAGQRETESACFALGGKDPRGETREPRLGTESGRQFGPMELQRAAAAGTLELFGIPTCAARDRLPRDPVERIARTVFALSLKHI
jgi:hypothetical protein